MAVKVRAERRYENTRVLVEGPRALAVEVVEEKTPPQRKPPAFRIAPQRGGVAIWSHALFRDPPVQQLRQFLSRVFRVQEITAVQIDRRASVARLKYGSAEDAPLIWRKLKRVLVQPLPVSLDDEILGE